MPRNKLLLGLGVILGLAVVGAVASNLTGGGASTTLFVAESYATTQYSSPPLVHSYPATWTPSANIYARIVDDAGIPTNQVIVALQPIPKGSEFVAGSIGRRDWPAGNIPTDVISDEAEAIAKVASTDIVQGQVIVQSMLANSGEVSTGNWTSAINDPVQTQGRRVIIYTGQIWLVVKDTQETITTITQLVDEKGGYVSESSIYQTSNNVLQGSITVRVPSEHYQTMMADLRALALRVEREEARSQDVTEEFTDQEARLTNLKAGEEALQKLLTEQQQDSNIADIAVVQQKLAEVRGQIEQTEGRLRYLTDQAFLSTIKIDLIPETLPPTPTPIPTPLPGWAPQEVVTEASQSLVFSLQQTLNSVIWGIIFIPLLVIYLIPVVIVGWLIRWGWRRSKAKKEILSPTPTAE